MDKLLCCILCLFYFQSFFLNILQTEEFLLYKSWERKEFISDIIVQNIKYDMMIDRRPGGGI